MFRRLLLLTFTGLCSLFCQAPVIAVATASDKPLNVLFIIADDLNNSMSCYGDPLVRTPNLDRLAARGTRFDTANCTFPLCGPSRNSLLTGLYPNSTGILANSQIFRQTIPDTISLPQCFRQQGYFAGRIGKLYHYNVPNSIGTVGHDDPASWELQLNPAGVDRTLEHERIFSLVPGQFGGTLSWYASPHSDPHHTDALQAADAEWVLERCARESHRPFFLSVGFFRPHTPYVAPKTPWFDMYDVQAMPLVSNVEADLADIPPLALASRKNEQLRMSDEQRQQARQAYYASISFMDAQVGRILDALDRLQLTDRTIIVFTSDHGYHLGEHGLWQKQSLFEESSRVPLLIAAPGTAAGQICRAPVSHVDLFPTLAELCGIQPPAGLQGQSLLPLLRDSGATSRGWALTQVVRGNNAGNAAKKKQAASDSGSSRLFGYSIRTQRYRYTEWDAGRAGRELYDHEADPRELTNLAEHPGHATTVSELTALLKQAIQSTLPASGQIPEIREGLWAPLLLKP
ncbi:MAG: sulfatase [Planctomycetota bacterium]